MPRQKHRPQRTCIVCRETKDKQVLIRLVRTPEGKVIVDPTGKANGRGAYLCRNADCWDKGMQKGRIAQALNVTLSAEELTALRACLRTEFAEA